MEKSKNFIKKTMRDHRNNVNKIFTENTLSKSLFCHFLHINLIDALNYDTK